MWNEGGVILRIFKKIIELFLVEKKTQQTQIIVESSVFHLLKILISFVSFVCLFIQMFHPIW